MPFLDESGKPVELSPAEQAEYFQQAKPSQQPAGSLVDDQGKPVDPFRDLSSSDLADLAKQSPDKFDLISQFVARPDLQKDPATVQKVADAFHELRQQPIDWKDLAKHAPGNITNIFAGLGRFGLKATSGALKQLASLGIAATPGKTPEEQDEAAALAQEESRQELGEAAASAEQGMTGLVSGIVKTGEGLARWMHLAKPLKDYSDADKVNALFDATARIQQAQGIASGQGPLAQAVTGGAVPVRPEEVAKLTDPFSWEAMGGLTRVPGNLLKDAGTVFPGAAETVSELAAKLPSTTAVTGKTIEGTAKLGAAGMRLVEKLSGPIGAVGAPLYALATHDPKLLAESLIFGSSAAEKAAGLAEKTAEGLDAAANFGKQIASGEVSNAYSATVRDAIEAAPKAAGSLAAGVGFDLSQVAGADTPQEREAAVGLGSAFGLLGAANAMGRHVISGEIVGPRAFDVNTPVSTAGSGQFPALEALHKQEFSNLTPGQRARLNTTRLFLSKADPNVDVFVANPDDPHNVALTDALKQSGMDADRAAFYANQKGFSTKLKGRKVIVVKDPGAAPHEAFHGIEDVLGEALLRNIDAETKAQYADQWENFGKYYTSRLTGKAQGDNWRDALLDRSGWGRAHAMEKAYAETAQNFSTEARQNGTEPPTEQQVKDAVAANPPDWRTSLTPEEQRAAADRYISRELLAENFDTWFKHTGGTMEPGKQMPERIARVLGNVMQFFGSNPIADRRSAALGVPLTPQSIQTAGFLGKSVLPDVSAAPTLRGARVPPMISPVAGAAPTQVAQTARQLAADQPDAPLPGQNQSQREIAGAAAEAFANDAGLHLQYSSAPDEPAASLSLGMNRNDRRSMIQAFREMPDSARQLFGKLFFPKKFVQTKSSGLQIQGWSPEVFAANAHRWGKFVGEQGLQSPYETDAKGLTEKGWQDLYNDLQNYVANQRAGLTGAGESLVVPKKVTEAGYSAPPTVGVAGEAVPQEKADVLNMLFGFKLPGKEGEATRAGGGGTRLPQNIAGRLVSEATQPGRVTPPVEPRGAFGGAAAERQGVAGEPVMEVNPYRALIEQAAKDRGVQAPSMIESWQNLNLNRIKEAEVAPEQPKFGANPLTLQAGFLPKSEVEIEGPDGKKYRATFDGFQDMNAIGRGMVPQFTAQENFPGGPIKGSTTYSISLEKAGYKVPAMGGENQTQAQFMAGPWQHTPTPALSEEGKKLEAAGYSFGHGSNENLFHGITVRDNAGNIVGTAQGSQMGAPTRAAIGDVVAPPDVAKGARAEMWAYLRSRGYRTIDDYSQFEPASDKQMADYEKNRAAYETTPWWKRPFVGESETGRHSSFVGDADRGVVLHSAKQRSTVFLNPERAKDFLAEVSGAKTPEQKDSAIESYFTKGSGTGVEGQFQPPKTFVVRHGSTEMNSDNPDKDRIRGHINVPLDNKGKQEAQDSGKQIAAEGGVQHIITSDLDRTVDTAKAIQEHNPGATITEDAGLRPWNFGPTIEGKPTSEMLPKIKELTENPDQRPPGGETFNEFKDRFLDSFHRAQDTTQDANAAIVTHYRGTKLLDAWRKTGVDNDTIDKAVFEKYDKAKKPGNVETIDKTGAELKTAPAPTAAPEEPTQFQVAKRRSKDDYKFPEGGEGLYSRAWIKPDGSVVQLGSQQHHDWLNENPDVKKQYGIKGSDIDNREEALRKGFARVHYEKNTGTLKVEARAKDWPKLQESVKQIAQTNLGKLDNMDVHLLDPKAKKVVASDGVQLHTYPTVEEKMAQLPFIGTAGGVTETSPQASTGMIGGQYMPAPEPRALRSAAVRDPETNQIFEGPFHAAAVAEALGLPSYRNATEATMASFQHGFTTNEGEFLNREEAHKRAQEMKQLAEGGPTPVEESPGFKKKGGIGIEHLKIEALQQMNEAKEAVPNLVFQSLPADTAGVTNRKDISDARKQWAEKGTESPYFKRWFGDSKITDDSGNPQVVYHGTTHKFSAFGDKRNNPENSLGAGHYFTTSESDARDNYGFGGPDLMNRINQRAGILESSLGLSRSDAEARADREIAGRHEQVIPAYLKAENPVVLDRTGNKSTRFEYHFDEDTGQETGTSVDLYNSVLRVAQQHGADGQKIWNGIIQNGADDLNAYDVWKGIKDSEEAMYGNDPEGRLMGSEIARQVFEDMGFDGIELTHPAKEFLGMNIDEDAKHFVVFKPEQVKGVQNRGTFSQQDPRFQFMPHADPEKFKSEGTLPEALHNSRYAILTANRESIGPASHPVNQDANDNLEKALIADGYNPHPVSGEYNGVDQGKNFLVPGMTPQDAIRYAKNYGQESVLGPEGLIYQNGMVNPANPAGVKIGDEAKKTGNWSQVAGGPAFSMDLDFSKQVPLTQFSPQTDLFGAPMAPEEKKAGLSTLEKSKLTKEGIAQQYPEVVIPKKRDQAIPSDIVNSPLYKEAAKKGGEAAAVNAFADRLESFAKEYQDHPSFKAGAAWYDHIAPAIKKAFGKTAQIFAELLAATSPGQTPDLNFRDALQAHDRLVAGDYDRKVEKYHQGLEMAEDEKKWKAWLGKHGTDLPATPTPETFLGQWIDFHDLKLTKQNGKLFGHNSVPVLNVAARKWIADAGPKTSNFVQNLLGTGNEATIDLWADRTMRWAGYEGKKDRWRILPENKSGVDDKDFYFAQKVFSETAKRMGMRPDQLQGALWFAEKQRWADNGWSPLNLGTYEPEFAKIPETRAKVAQEQQLRELGKKIQPLTGEQKELMVEPRNVL